MKRIIKTNFFLGASLALLMSGVSPVLATDLSDSTKPANSTTQLSEAEETKAWLDAEGDKYFNVLPGESREVKMAIELQNYQMAYARSYEQVENIKKALLTGDDATKIKAIYDLLYPKKQ